MPSRAVRRVKSAVSVKTMPRLRKSWGKLLQSSSGRFAGGVFVAEEEAVAFHLHHLPARAPDHLPGQNGHGVEHHQEMQDPVARGAQREVGGVREDDAPLAEELREALAVQLRPLRRRRPVPLAQEVRQAARAAAAGREHAPHRGNSSFTTRSAAVPPHSTTAV